MAEFLDSLDIANRACDYCGVDPIESWDEVSVRNDRISRVYDQLRAAEMERNVWRFTIRNAVLRPIDSGTLILVPSAYDATRTYMPGEVVSDSNRNYWISQIADNLNNSPGGNNEAWDSYFGPVAVAAYDSTTAYSAGELAYVVTGASPNGYRVFMSLVSDNSDNPSTPTPWSAATQYDQDQAVSYGGFQWRSLIPVNLNNTPADPPLAWASGTAYSSGNLVVGSDNFIYSAIGSTTGNDPTTDGGVHWSNTGNLAAWTKTPALVASSINWRPLVATLRNPFLTYPIGSGPASQSASRNVFRLPAGYLKMAPQAPKSPVPYLGAPTGAAPDDWELQGHYIVSSDAGNITLRFAANVTRVRDMTAMFCEGLAARIAYEVSPFINQSEAKQAAIAKAYSKFMDEARAANFIETGPVDAELDDFITCRM